MKQKNLNLSKKENTTLNKQFVITKMKAEVNLKIKLDNRVIWDRLMNTNFEVIYLTKDEIPNFLAIVNPHRIWFVEDEVLKKKQWHGIPIKIIDLKEEK